MPIYEYQCKKCKAQIEVMQKMTDKPLAKCSACGGRMEKQWSTTGFQFVGSGWYVTDYAGKKSDGKEEQKSGAANANVTTTVASESATEGAKHTNKESKPESKDGKTASPKTNSSRDTSGD